MKRLLFVLATVAAVVAAMSTGAAASTSSAAAEPASAPVHFFDCLSDSNVSVPAGTTVAFQGGWAVSHLGLIQAFLQDVTVTASVNGTQVPNANSYFGATEVLTPEPGVTVWATFWTYSTGITLEAGQSLTFTTEWVLSHPLPNDMAPGPPIPAGSIFGTATCTVTAS